MREEDWLTPDPIDQRQLHYGNSVLRGGQVPTVEELTAEKESLIIE
jgi:hypothetical protein